MILHNKTQLNTFMRLLDNFVYGYGFQVTLKAYWPLVSAWKRTQIIIFKSLNQYICCIVNKHVLQFDYLKHRWTWTKVHSLQRMIHNIHTSPAQWCIPNVHILTLSSLVHALISHINIYTVAYWKIYHNNICIGTTRLGTASLVF